MKKITLMFYFILMLFFSIKFFSCRKGNADKYPTNPDWLTEKISQMDTATYYEGTVVYLYKWDNYYYYLISNPLSNCILCDFYDYQGLKNEWSTDKFDDFEKNGKRIKAVWSRPL